MSVVEGVYDLAPQAWDDEDERARAVGFWTRVLQERAWRSGMTLAEAPSVSWDPPDKVGGYYRDCGMGRLRLAARAWRRLDMKDAT